MIKRKLMRTALATLTLFLTLSSFDPDVRSQQKPAPRFERDYLISVAREIMTTARYCALITRDAAGQAHARTMDPFPPEADMRVWLATNPRSEKVAEVRRHQLVTLYYFDRDSNAYVAINGLARLVNDPNEKAKRWKDEWKAFYPNRARDYLLIEVIPQRMEVVSEKKGVVGDQLKWKPPSVSFGMGRS
jgi:general stress protein 26